MKRRIKIAFTSFTHCITLMTTIITVITIIMLRYNNIIPRVCVIVAPCKPCKRHIHSWPCSVVKRKKKKMKRMEKMINAHATRARGHRIIVITTMITMRVGQLLWIIVCVCYCVIFIIIVTIQKGEEKKNSIDAERTFYCYVLRENQLPRFL